jgi:drug/metabolite transporter (DMT)-like permease
MPPTAPLVQRPDAREATLLGVAVVGIGASAPLIAAAPVPPLAIALWRNLLGVVAITPVVLRRAGRAELRLLWADRALRRVVLLSGVALAVHFATWVPAVTLTTVTAATALGAAQPVWNALIARWQGATVRPRAWVGIAVALAGVLLLTGLDLGGGRDALLGDLLALVGGMAAAVYVALGAKARETLRTTTYAWSCYLVCAVVLLVGCVLAGVPLVGWGWEGWVMLLALTVLAQLLGHTLLNRAVGTVGPVLVALVILLEVPAATLIAAAWLGQVPAWGTLPAALLVLLGVALVVTGEPPERVVAIPEG